MEALSVRLEQYEGPLDLLLGLISKHKIDIFDITISELCDQYMAYLDEMRSLNMEIASDFIWMASELMLIKSKMLLPKREDEEDPRKTLVDALLEHQRAKLAAEFLQSQSALYFDRFTKDPDEIDSAYERLHAVNLLTEAFERINERMSQLPEQTVELFERIETEHFHTVEGKILHLLRFMYDGISRPMTELFYDCSSRAEIIAAFLALLELVKAGRIVLLKDKKELYLQLIRKKR